MAGFFSPLEQALPLLAAVNNHGDLAVKLSSLRQAKDILLNLEASHAAELFPYLVELHSSPETLVRKYLIEVIDEIGMNLIEHLPILFPVLLILLKDENSTVAKQSVITGTKFFCRVLEELSLQFQRSGTVERWLGELWTWMIKFREAVSGIIYEVGALGPKLLALKFLETYILQFSLDSDESEICSPEAMARRRKVFNISWIIDGHPVLDPSILASDSNRYLGILLDMLRPPTFSPGSLTISAVNSYPYFLTWSKNGSDPGIAELVIQIRELLCNLDNSSYSMFCDHWKQAHEVNFTFSTFTAEIEQLIGLPHDMRVTSTHLAAIARRRPVYYKSVLNALLEFDPSLEKAKGHHTVSIQYSLRTAFLGFLRCTHPVIVESREKLLKMLRASNAGDAADQVIRQIDKILRNNERASRDPRFSKDDQLPNQLHISGDVTKKRPAPLEREDQNNSFDGAFKRSRYGPSDNAADSVKINDAGEERLNFPPKLPLLDKVLTPVEQMIAMIAALIGEGERGVDSLELLISNIHPDLLADIVITNMKHLSKNLPSLTTHVNLSSSRPFGDSNDLTQAAVSNGLATSALTSSLSVQVPVSSSNMTSLPLPDLSSSPNLSTDSKRDPRRDPRRHDPRRAVVPVDVPLTSFVEENTNSVQNHATQSDLDAYSPDHLLLPPLPPGPPPSSFEHISVPLRRKTETDVSFSQSPVAQYADHPIPKDELSDIEVKENTPDRETNNASHFSPSSIGKVNEFVARAPMDVAMLNEAYSPSSEETDQLSLDISNVEASEVASSELPVSPMYIELAESSERNVTKQALERIVSLYQNWPKTNFTQIPVELVARLFGQTSVDEVVGMVQKHIVSDYEQQKGHEFVMQILYHLQSLVISGSVPSAVALYENFLLGVANSLLDALPASDKSFSRLLGDVPVIPDSVLRLLEDICTESNFGGDGRDSDRVTQGLGSVWSLILGRPPNRQACLDIALKCAVHTKDDVRVKSIRLVANKLYAVTYISENIEQFATHMFLSSVDQRSDTMPSESLVSENRMGGQVESQETSISGSQVSEPGISQIDAVTYSQVQGLTSLYFALCTKKPSLLQLVFDTYDRAPKVVKQAVNRHIPNIVRTLGTSCPDLLHIISNPPQGSESLLIQVLHELSEGIIPSPDFVATVQKLYVTRLKDACILIPILSAFSRDEVLRIFAQLVNLPLDKFQTALAHILQGSASTGPALSPVEVLVAIHDVSPEKDGVPLKKITDACSACFEQRTVFTELVLSKALQQMVDQIPLPLLFMRTVIQAIDKFPTLVDCVMEILSRLVQRQIWRMPKLWVGFLKCISQTQPHSFRVLLQLPSPQLESTLNKYASLRGPLIAFVNQSTVKTSLPRSTLVLLGIASEEQHTHPLHASSDPGVGSTVRGTTFT